MLSRGDFFFVRQRRSIAMITAGDARHTCKHNCRRSSSLVDNITRIQFWRFVRCSVQAPYGDAAHRVLSHRGRKLVGRVDFRYLTPLDACGFLFPEGCPPSL